MDYKKLIYDYTSYGEKFEDLLNDENFPNIAQTSSSDSEELKRIKIFRQALFEKKGIKWVNEALASMRLRALYPRNPVEFALKYCFICNDTEGAPKYNHKDFNKLWDSLETITKDCKNNFELSGKLTFGQLRKFVLENSDNDNLARPALHTQNFTNIISDDLQGIDVTKANALSEFKSAFTKCCEQLSEASYSIRFYFAKYTYYIICHQIIEFLEILTEFSTTTPYEFLTSYDNRNIGKHYFWSLKKGIYDDEVIEFMLRKKVYGDTIYDSPADEDIMVGADADYAKKAKDEPDKELKSELLRSILNNFILYGTSQTDTYFKPFGKNKSLSEIKNQYKIFSDAKDKETHATLINGVRDSRISDFYGYPINYNTLYYLLFEKIISHDPISNDKEQSEQRKDYLLGILKGNFDMSRSAVLLFLASATGALLDYSKLEKDSDIHFIKDDALTLGRINHMLNRMGYVNVGDESPSEDPYVVDEIYYELFTAVQKNVIALDSFSDAIYDIFDEKKYNPLPLDISKMSTDKRKKQILKRNSK